MRALALIVLSVAVVSVLFVAVALAMGAAGNEGVDDLFSDVYELTGSRLSGLVSIVGVMLLVATSAVCLFASAVVRGRLGSDRWARFLLGAGLLTAVLAADDYLSIHEFADDVLAMATGVEADRVLKNVLEAGVLGVYGVLLTVLLWRFRSLLASGAWVLLAIAAAMLIGSLTFDLAPHSWLDATFGFSLEAQTVVEDTLKLTGLGFYAAYFVRTSAQVVENASR